MFKINRFILMIIGSIFISDDIQEERYFSQRLEKDILAGSPLLLMTIEI